MPAPVTARDNGAVWKVAQIAFLARQAITALDRLPSGVREIDADTLDDPVDLDPKTLRHFAEALLDTAAQIETIAAGLPDRRIRLDRPQIRAAADRALRHGIAAPEQVLFATRQLPYRDAYRALAHALETTDARLTWDDLTVADLLSNATGATIGLARMIASIAGLAPSAELSRCTHAQATALADAVHTTVAAGDPS
jgi:hypothetical protein